MYDPETVEIYQKFSLQVAQAVRDKTIELADSRGITAKRARQAGEAFMMWVFDEGVILSRDHIEEHALNLLTALEAL